MQGRDDLCTSTGNADTSPERALWLAVISQAITDAAPAFSDKGHSSHEALVRRSATQWFEGADFARVCDLAGLDADWARYRIGEAIKKRVEFRESFQLQHYRRAVA